MSVYVKVPFGRTEKESKFLCFCARFAEWGKMPQYLRAVGVAGNTAILACVKAIAQARV